jgi:hypothetical protein
MVGTAARKPVYFFLMIFFFKKKNRLKRSEEKRIWKMMKNQYTIHIAKKCLDKDYTLDFIEKSRREKLIQLYSVHPSVLPASEVKPLKFSSKNKFANTMEINLDMAGNAQAKGIEALENGDADLGHWHLANSMEFIRNAHSLANLERLKIRDPSSVMAIKNYVEGAELITPQARKIAVLLGFFHMLRPGLVL